MIRSPMHITHESIQAFYHRFHQTPSWILLQSHNTRLLQALATKRQLAIDLGMADADASDFFVHTPEYPSNQLDVSLESMQPPAQASSLAYPQCHRQFNQAGFLKRHMRMMLQVPYVPEDIFNPLRDSYLGLSRCNHCKISFSNTIAMKTYINKRICPHFDMHQAMVIPIEARPDVCMHLRHRSFIGFLFDQSFCSELASRCAFYQQTHVKAMSRHYRDNYQDLFRHVNVHQDFIKGLASFGSGRGECPLCRIKTFNVQQYHCCVIFQLAAMTGHIYQPANFPIMPCMKHAWYPSAGPGIEDIPDEAPLPAPAFKKQCVNDEIHTETPGRGSTHPPSLVSDPGSTLHKCQ